MKDAVEQQGDLFFDIAQAEAVKKLLLDILASGKQPSAWELLEAIDSKVDMKARWELMPVLEGLTEEKSLTRSQREYCDSLRKSEDIIEALRGEGAPKKEIESGIDSLLQQSNAYRNSGEFQDMVTFIGRFKDYAPYNNMLVRVQNPSCSFYATKKDWLKRFERYIIEDAHPMLILAPMHPVILVYDIDQTEGKPLPKELTELGTFKGEWNQEWLSRMIENARIRDLIRVDFKTLSSTNAGFATINLGYDNFKMRIAIHDKLDEPSCFGVLCHELAHIYLGHLESDKDYWWPSRANLDRRSIEIEAEATAFIVASRFELKGSSATYVSGYLQNKPLPETVSLDLIAKVAGRIEKMATETLAPRRRSQRK